MNCTNQNDVSFTSNNSFGSGFLIVVVLYILLAIILGTRNNSLF